jgi:hypothetical protein
MSASDFTLIKAENFATLRAFFTAYPEIELEPLDREWEVSDSHDPDSECPDMRNCECPEIICCDETVMIRVITWRYADTVLLDVYSYPGDNQAGLIYHQFRPILINSDGYLSGQTDLIDVAALMHLRTSAIEGRCDDIDVESAAGPVHSACSDIYKHLKRLGFSQ